MVTKRTLFLLAALLVVSVALLGRHFWLVALLCALGLVMVAVMAGRDGILADGYSGGEPEYVSEIQEEGVFDNGAEGLRVFARTGVGSEAEWRELASEISQGNGSPDFLWVDVLEEPTSEPRAVVAVFGTKESAEALGSDSFSPDGGKSGDGVYVFGPEELRDRGYSPGMEVFDTAE